ncbi:YkgJ family cysteine cluster protein [Acetobacteraceae bacterium H6797]|nr:YkgJ family cysteine cluster protein [Acetobacteraceae bacterium H6797]
MYDCQTCGACCAYSREWPRFSMESEAEIALIPAAMVAENGSGMRCEGERCTALKGELGKSVGCTIYAVRPLVCRDCQPGDEECLIARRHHGLPV